VTVDHLASEYFAPGFVKMDIEGAETAAVRGATQTLAQCDRWLIETHGFDAENECLRILTAHGFRIVAHRIAATRSSNLTPVAALDRQAEARAGAPRAA
jgi:hypothetical protein